MSYLTKLISLILIANVALAAAPPALAQEAETPPEVIEAVNLDEDIQPQDLGVGPARLLPDSPFYFLKEWSRDVQSFFAFNPVDKANLRQKFANQRLMEVKEMTEKNKAPELIEKGLENYQKEIEKIKTTAESIKENAVESEKVNVFLDKFVQQQTLHNRVLEKLEQQVPAEVLEKITQVKETHLEKFGEVMNKLENRENIQQRLEENLKKIKGSEFKEFKNMEMLRGLEEKAPEQIKEAVLKVRENALKNLKETVETMDSEKQEKFENYIKQIGGESENHLEIIEDLKSELKENPVIREKIIQIRQGVLETVEKKAKKIECPELAIPHSDFCKEGRIAAKRNEQGCTVSFECVVPVKNQLLPLPKIEAPQLKPNVIE